MSLVDAAIKRGLITVLYTTRPEGTAYLVYNCHNDKCQSEHRHTKSQTIDHMLTILGPGA